MSNFRKYRRKHHAEMRPYESGEHLSDRVIITEYDKKEGSPKIGDMIARNPLNHDHQWLVSSTHFTKVFDTEPLREF